MQVPEPKAHIIHQLKKELLLLQGFNRPVRNYAPILPSAIEASFPQNIFPTGALHYFSSFTTGDAAATDGFMAGLLGRVLAPRPLQKNLSDKSGQTRADKPSAKVACIWVNGSTVFPPALTLFGILPENIVFVQAGKAKESLWIVEEALKCQSLVAVVGQLKELSFTESRRLQLAVEKSGVTGLIHRRCPQSSHPIACAANWKITAANSVLNNLPGVGPARWQVELTKVRNGKTGNWLVEWQGGCFKQVAKSPFIFSRQETKTAG